MRSALEFETTQVATLAEHVLGRRLELTDTDALCQSSTGQPALLVMLLRHIAVSQGSVEDALLRAPTDVTAHLERNILPDTDAAVLTVLGVASILGSGTLSQLVDLADTTMQSVEAAIEAVPLLRIASSGRRQKDFSLHDLACEVYRRAAFDRWWRGRSKYLAASASELASRKDFHRLFRVLVDSNDRDLLVVWTECLGFELIEDAQLGLLEWTLDCIPVAVQAGSVRLMLVGALLKRAKGEFSEALERVAVAQRLAGIQGDAACLRECLVVEARLRWDTAGYRQILPRLARTHETAMAEGDYDTAVLMCGYLASGNACLGNVEIGRDYALQYAALSRCRGVSSKTRVQALQATIFVLGLVCGDVAASIDLLKECMRGFTHSTEFDIQCEANLAALLLELGRLREADRLISRARVRVADCGLRLLSDACAGSAAAVQAGFGNSELAERLMSDAIEQASCSEDRLSVEYNRLYRAVIRRTSGRHDDALADAEDALARFSEHDDSLPAMAVLARCEVAASLLALGDRPKAECMAEECRALAASWTAKYHLLRADMVLAEIERQRGDIEAAVARISLHADYVATESGNWQIAMYIRAFPGLLGVFSKAVGADALPAHMLRMILPEHAHQALGHAVGIESREGIERLSVRLLGHADAAVFARSRQNTLEVRVQLFGGMQVDTPSGRVSDRDWRKRKARLLFAIIVLQHGKDLSREQLFEHLWPEMTEDRAKSNFYVIWSTMRRVLMGGSTGGPCPFVEHQGGVCRIVPSLVKSDVADFEDALTAMRRADRAGDTDLACAAADEIARYYRGELLPGELYDDWLAPIRDRYRHDYADAMLRAAQLHHEANDTEKALHMVRAALSQDPWREDLYQAALRYLIHSGQRSGAIETYTACRSRLCEDLGLDPSVETRRLYDEILAMEEP